LISLFIDDAISPTPDGVGVKGGGLIGDSSKAALRFLGNGVVGRFGIANSASSTADLASFCSDAEGALALRFFGTVVAFETLLYFATPFVALMSDTIGVTLLATRAERLRDMLR
jgi:hypothetical protein